jgi:D-arabinose 1-dehydrogenase-like Zn-dependent alcohol dehydrogenase
MAKMRAAQITGPNGPVEIVEREIPEPGGGQVRVRVEACGVCHSDSFTKEGSAGTAGTVATAILAGAAISSPVKSLLK